MVWPLGVGVHFKAQSFSDIAVDEIEVGVIS